jgi:hypothetical protein
MSKKRKEINNTQEMGKSMDEWLSILKEGPAKDLALRSKQFIEDELMRREIRTRAFNIWLAHQHGDKDMHIDGDFDYKIFHEASARYAGKDLAKEIMKEFNKIKKYYGKRNKS